REASGKLLRKLRVARSGFNADMLLAMVLVQVKLDLRGAKMCESAGTSTWKMWVQRRGLHSNAGFQF
ncbi:MAG: hypothetical protein ABF337_12375, partial [Akkermansiaceae bacterium]